MYDVQRSMCLKTEPEVYQVPLPEPSGTFLPIPLHKAANDSLAIAVKLVVILAIYNIHIIALHT